jgi:hypothetical protein
MLTLLNAIYSKFTATSALTTAFPGGLYRDRAAEGTAMPFLVSNVVAAPATTRFGGVGFSEATIRFTSYAVGHDVSLAAIQTFVGVFDELILTISGNTQLNTTRKNDPIPRLETSVDGSGQEVWRCDVIYDFAVQ